MKKLYVVLFFMLSFAETNAQQITEKKLLALEKLGNAIDSTLFNNDASYFDKAFHIKTFTDRFFIKSNDPELVEFNQGFHNGFSKSFSFGNEILNVTNSGSEYNFLKAYRAEGNYYLLFRLSGEVGINYHQHLIKFIDNKPRIIDSYIYVTGEYLSQTMKTIYNLSVNNRSFLKRLLNVDEIKDLKKLASLKQLRDEGKYNEVVDLYESLSDTSKKKKIFKIYALTSAQYLSNEVYNKYINEYKAEFPNDPSLHLISIDGFILKKQFDKALASIDKLEQTIGGDDFLQFFRGNIYYLKKDYKKAEEKFSYVIENYENFFDAYDSLLTVYVESSNFKEATVLLDKLLEKFEMKKEDFKAVLEETFEEFSKSSEFKNWLKK
ncbi:hypothetical protein [uncultured Tenacibaculum sp.]|uniref:tetratricopeptide repeat protein n=1 Tax=uncultured Tenacibaculum sp. TaxID=174713 RepID=UPI0026357AED|nr:hypothetical protein [uncultured Tenacibaculum sp.]